MNVINGGWQSPNHTITICTSMQTMGEA